MNSKKILYIGVLLGCLCLSLDRFVGIPESWRCFGMGITITMEIFGLYAMRHDMKKMREKKFCWLKKVFYRS